LSVQCHQSSDFNVNGAVVATGASGGFGGVMIGSSWFAAKPNFRDWRHQMGKISRTFGFIDQSPRVQ